MTLKRTFCKPKNAAEEKELLENAVRCQALKENSMFFIIILLLYS